MRVRLRTLVHSLNKDDVPEMRRIYQYFGMKFHIDTTVLPRLDGNKDPCQLRLRPQEGIALALEDEEMLQESLEYATKLWQPPPLDRLYFCSGGKSSYYIDATGKLTLCPIARTPVFDLRKHSFIDAWRMLTNEVDLRKFSSNAKCVHCDLRKWCDWCPAKAYLETGSEELHVPYLCEKAAAYRDFVESRLQSIGERSSVAHRRRVRWGVDTIPSEQTVSDSIMEISTKLSHGKLSENSL